jgi:hypothetical protein
MHLSLFTPLAPVTRGWPRRLETECSRSTTGASPASCRGQSHHSLLHEGLPSWAAKATVTMTSRTIVQCGHVDVSASYDLPYMYVKTS